MNLISKSLTRLECSPFFNPIIPTGKRITSHQIRFASVTGKSSSGGGRKKRTAKSPTKAPEAVITPVKSPEEEENELVRPNEIAYEKETSNWVNLIGFVDQPVQFDASEDGKFWAGTVVSQRLSISDSSAFWIPVIFEGDLAKVAARFVKKDDRIRVSGKLFIDSPPQNVTYPQSNVQVLVQKLDFVQPETESKAISSVEKEESGIKKRHGKVKKDVVTDEAFDSGDHHTVYPEQSQSDSSSMVVSSEKEESSIKKRPARVKKNIVANEAFESWDHLIDHPKQGQPDSSSMVVSSSGKEDSGIKKRPARAQDIVTDETSDSWNRLIENPKQWWDHRENKVNGLVKPRHPDFKSKDRSLSLWLNKAPSWVLPKLEGLEFDVLVPKARAVKQLKGEESWKELVQNPDKWWDNRVDKRNAKAPDFKHKETGEALWLNESPTWVLPNLPPVKKKQESFVSVV